ncbi:MAG: VTT domain-containing protein [Chloroflexota bacterium]
MSGSPRLAGWRLRVARVLALAAVVAITAFVFSVRDQAEQLGAYGYPGIFLISVLANATVILPAPGIAITFAMGAVFHPVAVALAAGTGAALGELTGYLAGFSGQGVVENAALYDRLKGWMQRYGGWAILALAFIPNPFFDLAGAAAGALRMPLRRFLTWVWLGKVAKMLVIAYAGSASIDWLAGWLH